MAQNNLHLPSNRRRDVFAQLFSGQHHEIYTFMSGTMHSYIEGVQAGKLLVEKPHRIAAQLRTPSQRQLGDVSSQHGAHAVYRVIAQTLPAADNRRCVCVCVCVCVRVRGQCSSGKS